jgi:hypothetical protein
MAAPLLCSGPGIADPRGRRGLMDWRFAVISPATLWAVPDVWNDPYPCGDFQRICGDSVWTGKLCAGEGLSAADRTLKIVTDYLLTLKNLRKGFYSRRVLCRINPDLFLRHPRMDRTNRPRRSVLPRILTGRAG